MRRCVQSLHGKSPRKCAQSLQCSLSSTIVNEIPESAQLAGPILPIRSIAMRRLPVGLQLISLALYLGMYVCRCLLYMLWRTSRCDTFPLRRNAIMALPLIVPESFIDNVATPWDWLSWQ